MPRSIAVWAIFATRVGARVCASARSRGPSRVRGLRGPIRATQARVAPRPAFMARAGVAALEAGLSVPSLSAISGVGGTST